MTTKNSNLHGAKQAKNDEFYTQYHDIEKEMQAYLDYNPDVFRDKVILLPCDDPEWSNFTKYFAQRFSDLGLKKLISTSYVKPKDDSDDSEVRGKIFTLTRDVNQDGVIDLNDLEWEYLQGDGDFRSEEVTRLRDEADIIITNPPFSLFREFLAWIVKADKSFTIISNMNAITYKEVFPLIKENEMWLGVKSLGVDTYFDIPKTYADELVSCKKEGSAYKIINGKIMGRVQICWFTNIEHGRRHQPLDLDTMQNILRFNNSIKANPNSYKKYENYDAIEIPRVEAIPKDYNGVMGVPISFLDKYCPEQFEIIGLGISNSGIDIGVQPYKPEHKKYRKEIQKRGAVDGDLYMMINNEVVVPYARILIKHKTPTKKETNNAN